MGFDHAHDFDPVYHHRELDLRPNRDAILDAAVVTMAFVRELAMSGASTAQA